MTHIQRLLALLLVSIATLLPPQGRAQFIAGPALELGRQLADKSLRDYVAGFLMEDNVRRFGFKSLGDAQSAQVGEPVPILFAGLRELKAYRAGAGVGAVLSNARALWFPVVVQGEVRAKLELTEIGGKWVAGEFGRPTSAQRFMRTLGTVPKLLEGTPAPKGARVALVRVPALGVELFYAPGPEGGQFVVASTNGEVPGIEDGKVYPADALLARLSELAQTIREDEVR